MKIKDVAKKKRKEKGIRILGKIKNKYDANISPFLNAIFGSTLGPRRYLKKIFMYSLFSSAVRW